MSYLLKASELYLAPKSSPLKKTFRDNHIDSPLKMVGSLEI